MFLLIGLVSIKLVFSRWLNPSGLHLLNVPRNVDLSFNVSHLYASPQPVATYRRDQYGLRGRFGALSSIDILTVGGSTTDQRSLGEGSTWQDILRDEFRSHGKNVSIVNAGVDGQSTYGHIKNFDVWFPQIPDLRVRYFLFYVGINDFWADQDNAFDNVLDPSPGQSSQTVLSLLADRSAVYYLYRTIRGMVLANVVFRLDHHRVDWSRVRYVERPKIADHESFMRSRILAYEERLRTLSQRTRQLDAIPIFVTQVYWSYKVENGKVLGTSRLRPYAGADINGVDLYRIMELINGSTMKVCGETHGVCIDLAKELSFGDDDFYDGAHNTPDGAKKIGRYLHTKLQDLL